MITTVFDDYSSYYANNSIFNNSSLNDEIVTLY